MAETSVLASHNETKRRLTSLANVGATIIIDDFGTGHASLSQLIDMSASVIKVDREFVERLGEECVSIFDQYHSRGLAGESSCDMLISVLMRL